MSNTAASLRRKLASAENLQSVVRTMKAVAASSVGQYEQSVQALADYYRTVELGLSVCFRKNQMMSLNTQPKKQTDVGNQPNQPQSGEEGEALQAEGATRASMKTISAIVFGSDQGLVGQFNDVVAKFAVKTLSTLPGQSQVWAVGERVQARLEDTDLQLQGIFTVPNSVQAIIPIIGEVLVEIEKHQTQSKSTQLYLFYNRPSSGAAYEPICQQLLPLDQNWQRNLAKIPWPTQNLPEVINGNTRTLPILIREYLFISLFRGCAESLASENASRLASMQRADKNIGELLEDLHRTFHRLRQSRIDEELFDVISGFEALKGDKKLNHSP